LQRFDSENSGLFGAVGFKFNPISTGCGPHQKLGECHTIANAWING
jgi:hypothetical protein